MEQCTRHGFSVPTYYGGTHANLADDSLPEYGPPHVDVVAYREHGIRIILGIPERECDACPDIKLERRPNGWAIFLHPEPNGDPSAFVYFIDDGRSVLIPESWPGAAIEIRPPGAHAPEVDLAVNC